MEIWMIYAIGGAIATGMFGFLQKIEAEGTINRNSFIFYSHVGMIILPLMYYLFFGGNIYFDKEIFLFAVVLNTMYVVIMKMRLKSLQYLDSSSYFINYRVFSSILLLLFGQVIFGEKISMNEYIGIFLGFIIFYLLMGKKYNQESDSQLWKGYSYLGGCVIFLSIIWLFQKFFTQVSQDFILYLLYSGIIGAIATYILKGRQDTLKDILVIKNKRDALFLSISMTVFPLGLYFNLNAVALGGDVAIVYKIVSYSLFIPIIFSIIFYKEKITIKKLLAFILTIASIGLFV